MAEKLTGQDISFLSLQTAVFCVECELISKNNTPYCLACGSRAVLSLSRVLGGSLRGEQTAHLIADAELNRLVRELLRTVPASPSENRVPASFATLAPSRSHARAMGSHSGQSMVHVSCNELNIHPGEIDLEPAINVIAEHAQALTGATGAAIALRHGDEIICRARTGRTAPDPRSSPANRLWNLRRLCAHRRGGPLSRCRAKPSGRSGQLPSSWRALYSCGSPPPFPQNPWRIRSSLRSASRLRQSRRGYHATALRPDGRGHFAPVEHSTGQSTAVGLNR